MTDPRTILNLDPTRFLTDGDAVADWRPNDDDRWSEPDPEDWPALLACLTNLVAYETLDGIDLPDAERDELDLVALVGDDGRDADGELTEEAAEPFTRKVD